MKTAWQTYISQKKQAFILILSSVILCITLFLFLHFLSFNEQRSGFIFNDPVLTLFNPVDVSVLTFIITYSFSLVGIIFTLRNPELFLKLMQGYIILTWLRIGSLYLVPLEPPVNIIPLHDIFLQSSFYSGRENLKDLFFSGHTATIFLFALVFTGKKLKWIYFSGAIAIAILVMLQHVHYSIDVIAAPVFAFIAVLVQKKISF